METLRTQLFNFVTTPKYILPFLNPGRLIKVINKDDDFGWVIEKLLIFLFLFD